MKKQKIRSYRSGTSSLSSLNMVLTSARKTVPPRLEKKDASDELALRLIQTMKTEYKRRPSSVRGPADRSRRSVVNGVEKW